MKSADEVTEVHAIDIYHRLGSLESKLDCFITQMDETGKSLNICFERIRNLESNVNRAIGVGTFLVVALPILISWFAAHNNLLVEVVEPRPPIQSPQN